MPEHVETAVTVRAARRADAATIVGFQLRMAEETEDFALDAERLRAGVEAVFDDPGKGRYRVAESVDGEEAGEVVGCLLTVPEWSDWRNARVLWIHSVYVVPEARGRGVYRALHRHLVAEVKADPGLCGLRLYVEKRNQRAARVYEKLGMTREHYHLYEWLQDGYAGG